MRNFEILFRASLMFLIFSVCLSANGCAQKTTDIPIAPILLDKSALSGVGLKKIDLKDEPRKDFYQRKLIGGEDISVYVVSTQNWTNKIKDYPFDEFVYMLNGEAIVRPEVGNVERYFSGDFFFAARGYNGEWEINGGDQIHYELSVIGSNRSKDRDPEFKTHHQLFSKEELSGLSILLDYDGSYRRVLRRGNDLTVSLCSYTIGGHVISEPQKEKLVHLLSGQVTIIDKEGGEQTFYTGDFFLSPKGFTGEWSTNGHVMIKFLTVEKTDL